MRLAVAIPELLGARCALALALGSPARVVLWKLAAARRFFNNAVQEYNTGIQQFPAALFAATLGFSQRTFFDVGEERAVVEKAPQVKF